MACIASGAFHPYRAERESDVIHEDEYVLQLDVFFVFPVAYRIAGKIHVSGGFQDDDLLVFQSAAGDVAVAFGGEVEVQAFRQGVRYPETDVVAGADIFGADVAESYYQVFHFGI